MKDCKSVQASRIKTSLVGNPSVQAVRRHT